MNTDIAQSKKGISEVTPEFLTSLISDPSQSVISFESNDLICDAGIIANLIKTRTERVQGIFRYMLTVDTPTGIRKIPAVLKVKTPDMEIINLAVALAKLTGDDKLPELIAKHTKIFGFNNNHIREIEFYRRAETKMLAFIPKVFGIQSDIDREIFAILMEDISYIDNFCTVDHPDQWDKDKIEALLNEMAEMHSVYLDRYTEIPQEINLNILDEDALVDAAEMIERLMKINIARFPDLIPEGVREIYTDFIANIKNYIVVMKSHHMTLTHNDFNPRNLGLTHDKNGYHLKLYDWEAAAYQNPEHDLLEFLIYTLEKNSNQVDFDYYIEFYLNALNKKTGRSLSIDEFMKNLYLNAIEMAVVRFNLYLLGHYTVKFKFINRVLNHLIQFILNNSRFAM